MNILIPLSIDFEKNTGFFLFNFSGAIKEAQAEKLNLARIADLEFSSQEFFIPTSCCLSPDQTLDQNQDNYDDDLPLLTGEEI